MMFCAWGIDVCSIGYSSRGGLVNGSNDEYFITILRYENHILVLVLFLKINVSCVMPFTFNALDLYFATINWKPWMLSRDVD